MVNVVEVPVWTDFKPHDGHRRGLDGRKGNPALAVGGKIVGNDGSVAVLRHIEFTIVQRNARRAVESGGQHAPFDAGDVLVCRQRFHPRGVAHHVHGRGGGVVGVDPKHAPVCRVGDVEDSRALVEDHVARHAHQMTNFHLCVAVNNGVGMVVVAGVVVLSEVVHHQLAVVTVVVPIHVVVVVSNANTERGLVVHVDVASEQVVVLVFNRIVCER